MLRIGIVAGEPSGDLLAAGLIEALRARRPALEVSGIAGPRMAAAGCQVWTPIERLAVMGIGEIIARYPELKRLQRDTIRHFQEYRPDIFIGVDAPEFNLEVEQQLRHAGIRSVHYVSPTVWAWREGRLKKIRRAVDLMLTLFPFEETYYRSKNMPVTFVGHPLVDELASVPARTEARARLGIAADAQLLALLPGSRGSELKHHTLAFLKTAMWCASKSRNLQIIVPVVDDAAQAGVAARVRQLAADLNLRIVVGKTREALAAADCALIASGTATLEAMLLGCPMAVAYRASWLSYALIRPLLRIQRFSLPNLLAGGEIVEEFIQAAAVPEKMGPALLALLSDPVRRERMRKEFARLAATLQGGSSARAADAVLAQLV